LIARYDVNKNGVIEKREVIRAISDYFSGVEGLTKADVIRLISIYFDRGGGPGTTDPPGEVTLSSGQPQVGTELAATLTDADEGIADVIWLWERSTDQDSWSAISGAESASYTPVDADGGKYLRATASYTDGYGTDTADATGADAVTSTSNMPPSFPADTAPRSVDEDASVGADVGPPVSATDPDDDALTYTLGGADMADFAIDPATGQLKTKSPQPCPPVSRR
jgi:hypothetical protein